MALLRFRPSLRMIVVFIVTLVGLHIYFYGPSSTADTAYESDWHSSSSSTGKSGIKSDKGSSQPSKTAAKPASTELACKSAKGLEDIVFVIKTGATEVDERLPVHFNSTLRCWPHSLIFADYGEIYQGHTILDALGGITDQIRLKDEQFDLWRRLHELGRTGLDEKELSINHHVADPTDGGGNFGSGGWRLDKFKNIPMVVKTLELKPHAKWFIYTDADTFISWSNLLRWTKVLDPTKVVYMGSQAVISDQVFGHGGSGYLLSRPAMDIIADYYRTQQEELDNLALKHWAGDCVLAISLARKNVSLTWSFPILQGSDPLMMDYTDHGYEKKFWCYPSVSYHHLAPSTIQGLWEFEQEWMSSESADKPYRHGDVFQHYVLPQISSGEKANWNNTSPDLYVPKAGEQQVEVADYGGCRSICEANSKCLQFAYGNGHCYTWDKVKVGAASNNGSRSGWMVERIRKFFADYDHCSEGDWIKPDNHKR